MLQDNKRILVPVNGKPVADKAFRGVCRIAKATRAEIHAVYVIEVPLEFPLDAQLSQETSKGEEVLARIEAIADEEKCRVNASILQARQAGQAIIAETEERYMDLIVLGIPSVRRIGPSILGATTDYVLKYAHCQVLCWRDREPVNPVR